MLFNNGTQRWMLLASVLTATPRALSPHLAPCHAFTRIHTHTHTQCAFFFKNRFARSARNQDIGSELMRALEAHPNEIPAQGPPGYGTQRRMLLVSITLSPFASRSREAWGPPRRFI
jgi:hypothetical protein